MSTATVDEEPVHVWRLFVCILLGVLTAVGVFVATKHLVLALGGYVFAACLAFAVMWVIGSA